MRPDTIIAQCPDDGHDIRWSDQFAPPRSIGRLVELRIQCGKCSTKRRLRVHPDDLRQSAERYAEVTPVVIGEAVAYFRRVLDDVNVLEDIVEWKDLEV